MTNGQGAPPIAADVVDSLGAAAAAAHQAYMTADAIDHGSPAVDDLYKKQMAAAAIYMDAIDKQLNNDPAVAAAQQSLDALTKSIKSELDTIKNIATWVTLVDNLVTTATSVAKFFA